MSAFELNKSSNYSGAINLIDPDLAAAVAFVYSTLLLIPKSHSFTIL